MNEEEKKAIEKLYRLASGECEDTDFQLTFAEYEAKAIKNLIEKQQKEIEILKEKNSKLLEQNEDMKALFNIQASIAKELDFNTDEKMIRFKDEYYVPYTMAINANIGEPKTLKLRYVSVTKYF